MLRLLRKRKLPSIVPLTFDQKLQQWYGIEHRQALISDVSTRSLWAERGKSDLHFLCTAVLGYDRLVGPDRFHGEMCEFATQRGTGYGRASIVPRGHFKSTINTIGSTLQDLIIDPDDTILIVTGATKLHFKFLAAIKNHIENNKILHALYPYLKPSGEKWDAAEIIVKRSVGIVESSVTAMSWKQSPEGGHYGRIKVDDIAVKENMETRHQAEKVTEKLLDLWSNVETGDFLISGTRYANYDPYGYIIKYLSDEIRVFTIQAEIPGTEDPDYPGHGLPIFPERFPGRRLAQLRNTLKKGARYWAQYMNDPMPEELQVIKAAWFKPWHELPRDEDGNLLLSIYFGGDHASGSEQGGVSESVLLVGGVDEAGNIYHLETIGEIRSTADFINQTFSLCARWNPIAGLIEMQAAAGKMLKEQFNAEMRERNEYLPLKFETGGGVRKEKRIELAVSKSYEEGRLFHNPDTDELLEEQLTSLGKSIHLDRADALSYMVTLALRMGYWGAMGGDDEEEKDPFVTNWQNRRKRARKTDGVKVW